MHLCESLFSLIPKITVVSGASTRPPLPVLESLQAMGLPSDQQCTSQLTQSSKHSGPTIVVGSDRRKLVDSVRSCGRRECLFVDSDEPHTAWLGTVFEENSTEPEWIEHELSLDDGIIGLCQYFLQRTAIEFQSKRHYVIGKNLVGASRVFEATLDLTAKIAALDVGVYINGETGTGKELVARSIHYLSGRRERPFVAVNCGAFNDELILAELFGHAKGAYTGADKNRTGLIEQAEGGTFFLDEIDCLSTKAQVVLLRYLQEKEFRPVGSNTVKTANVRVIAASNTPLEELVSRRLFREDLLYRLDILRINVPTLDERASDKQLLAQFLLNRMSRELHTPPRILDSVVIASIDQYAWPGNIRQLENSLYRLFLLTDGFIIRTDKEVRLYDGEPAANATTPTKRAHRGFGTEKAEVIRQFEREYLSSILGKTRGNVSQAARLARKERTAFIRLMRKHKLDRKSFCAGFDDARRH